MPRSRVCLVDLEKRLVTHSPVLPEAEEGTTWTGGGGYQRGLPQTSSNIYRDVYIAMNFMLMSSQTIQLIYNVNKCSYYVYN